MASDYPVAFLSPVEGDTKEFLKLATSKLEWGDLSNAVVMDVGCASGSSCETIVYMFPAVKKVVGIDCLPEQIHFAILGNTSKQIEYEVANIENRFSLVKWDGKMDRIISIYCFNWVKDRETAFRNIYHLLKPGGGAAILQSIEAPFYRCLKRFIETAKWKEYGEDLEKCFPDSMPHKLEFSQYEKVVEEIGFKVVLCEKQDKIFDYPSEKAFRDCVVDKFPLLTRVPEPAREEFKRDYFGMFEEMNGRTADGRSRILYHNVMVLVKKE